MRAIWKRCLLAGLVASAVCVALPRGIGRDSDLLRVPHPEAAGVLLVDLDRFSEINDTL